MTVRSDCQINYTAKHMHANAVKCVEGMHVTFSLSRMKALIFPNLTVKGNLPYCHCRA